MTLINLITSTLIARYWRCSTLNNTGVREREESYKGGGEVFSLRFDSLLINKPPCVQLTLKSIPLSINLIEFQYTNKDEITIEYFTKRAQTISVFTLSHSQYKIKSSYR